MKKVDIYTDGACSGNPGPGGYGAVLFYGKHQKEISGFASDTTNNRMEITAVIEALKLLKEPVNVTIYSDSAYVCNAFEQNWINNWQDNEWRNANKKLVSNIDLWQELIQLLSIHKFNFVKVKGHANNEWNNRCDFLATSEISKNKKTSDS